MQKIISDENSKRMMKTASYLTELG